MKIVQRTGPGEIGLNYMWLPTWIGMNGALIKEIEAHIAPQLVGQELTEETLHVASEAVLDFLKQKFPLINGLFEYLDGLKYVETDGEKQEARAASSPVG
jgi:hypothetical protein